MVIILSLAGIFYIISDARDMGLLEGMGAQNNMMEQDPQNPQILQDGEREFYGEEEDGTRDMEVLPEPPGPGEQGGQYDYKNPPRGSEDNDPNAFREQ